MIDNFVPAESGTYFVAARNGFATAGMRYVLSASVSTPQDDTPGDATTAWGLAVDGPSANGVIEIPGDQDWFRVELIAGESYAFSLQGAAGSPLDAFLRIYHQSGSLVAIDDDGDPASGTDSLARFTATLTGTYFLSAGGFENDIGAYVINAAHGPAQNPLDTIDLEFTFQHTQIDVYFALAGQQLGPSGVALRNWSAAEKAAAMSALRTIADVTDLTFSETGSSANAEFVFTLSNLDPTILGQTWPDPLIAYIEIDPNGQGWTGAGLQPGGLGYSVIIHEAGHALGLAHPHLDGQDVQVMQGVIGEFNSYGSFLLNQQVFTIMSYNDGWPLGRAGSPISDDFGQAATPMALDVALLQARYGADPGRNVGLTQYVLPSVDAAGASYSVIWDAGGVDEIVSTVAAGAVIDLRPATLLSEEGGGGFVSYNNGVHGGYAIASGAVIENATGGAGVDFITGNNANNILSGGNGDDVLDGGVGADTLLGGGGDDRISWNAGDTVDGGAGVDAATIDLSSATAPIQFDPALLAGPAGISFAGATFRNMEAINLITGSGDDVYSLHSIAGASFWNAGAGFDTLILDASSFAGTVFSTTRQVSFNSGISTPSYELGIGDVEVWRLTGGGGADTLWGGTFDDVLRGNAGDDGIDGGGGADTLEGGDGADLVFGGDGADYIDGGAGNDTLAGGAGVDTLLGGAGDDTIDRGFYDTSIFTEADLFDGGAGRDRAILGSNDATPWNFVAALAGSPEGFRFGDGLRVSNVEVFSLLSGAGNDTVSADASNFGSSWGGGDGFDRLELNLSLAADPISILFGVADLISQAGLRIDILWGGKSFICRYVEAISIVGGMSADSLIGHDFADVLRGGLGDDALNGGGGDDTLDGGAGADVLIGGAGDDAFVVDNEFDITADLVGEGTDSVQSSITWFQFDHVENLSLTGAAAINGSGNAGANVIVGNSAVNQLFGLAGNDTLNGGAGVDQMFGGEGDDLYIVDNAADFAFEGSAAWGVDLVQASVSYTLGQNIDNLTLVGAALVGNGNLLANVITGNANANTLFGMVGNDTLNGAAGADQMFGGLGDDLYIVDNGADFTFEAQSAWGNDTVQTSVDYQLGQNIDNLVLQTGAGALIGRGNLLANTITGNESANTLFGFAGNDTLDGGLGGDQLYGREGDDTYIVDNVGDVVAEANAAWGIDTIFASVTFFLSANLEHLTLTGSGNVSATGNGLNNTITGNTGANTLFGQLGNDVLDGGAGADSLFGGEGDDLYIVDNAGDVGFEGNVAWGTDLVQASVSHTLGTNLDNLTLTGVAAIDATGNGLANVINGNSGANTLSGLGGADTLNGGAGNDTLDGGAGNDAFVFGPGSGSDTVNVFVAGGVDDTLNLSAYSGTGVTWSITQIGADTVFSFTNGDQITLTGVTAANLLQTDPFGYS